MKPASLLLTAARAPRPRSSARVRIGFIRRAATPALILGLALTFTLTLALTSTQVRAQETTESSALVDRGVERRRAGDDEGALDLFTRAWEAGHAPRARAQMALVEQALGHFVDAEAHLLEALAATGDEWIVRRRADLELALEAIELRLGYLDVRGGIAGADLRLDGRSLGTLPIERPIRLAAGSYRIEVIARRYYPFARQITIVPEGTTRETVVLARTSGAPDSVGDDARSDNAGVSPDGASHGARTRTVVGVSLLGGAGVMLATSAVTFAMRQSRAHDYNSGACLVGGATRGETCGDLYDDTRRAQHASVVTLTLGAALAAAGTLMFVIGDHDSEGSDSDSDAATVTAAISPRPIQVACGASIGAEWGGQCRLRF